MTKRFDSTRDAVEREREGKNLTGRQVSPLAKIEPTIIGIMVQMAELDNMQQSQIHMQ